MISCALIGCVYFYKGRASVILVFHRFAMAELRRSRRPRGLAPEESPLEQVCFICQRGIDINSVTRCQCTPCCGVFMHKPCYSQMVATLPTCGHCRSENEGYQREVVLETDEELESDDDPFEIGTLHHNGVGGVLRELRQYRNEQRFARTHYYGSLFWTELPYVADAGIWLDYYHKLEAFMRLFSRYHLYVHGRVSLPVDSTVAMRRAMYRMFVFNTPFTVFSMTQGFHFRLLFVRDDISNTVRVDHLSLLPHSGGPPLYRDDFLILDF